MYDCRDDVVRVVVVDSALLSPFRDILTGLFRLIEMLFDYMLYCFRSTKLCLMALETTQERRLWRTGSLSMR